ncbi:MAG: hypothetical protein ACT4RN_24165 [Pseudonocardia sp.]
MNGTSSARLVAALALITATTLGMVGPAAAAPPPGPDGGGTATRTAASGPPSQAAGQPDPRATNPGLTSTVPPPPEPCPVAAPGPGPVAPRPEEPDPKVTNPGPGTGVPCPTGSPAPATPAPETPGNPTPDPTAGAQAPPAGNTGQHASAPTANLRKLAEALTVRTKGITTAVLAPPGLGVGPIEISFSMGANRITTQYGNENGSRHAVDAAPQDGTVRDETLAVSLLERTPGGPYHYAIVQVVRVEPLYRFEFGALRVQAYGGCDLFGAPDPTVSWVDADGMQRQADAGSAGGPYGNDLVPEFSAEWRDVSVNRGLTLPTVEWFDRDVFGPVGQNALSRGAPLLPRPGRQETRDTHHEFFSEVQPEAGGQDCKATVSYRLTVSSQSHYVELTR